MTVPFSRAEAIEILEDLLLMAPGARRGALLGLPPPALRAIAEEWWWQAHGGQIEPEGNWRIWSIVAARGFGKTRAGAEWVWQRARENPGARIALVGASAEEVAKYQVEGECGLLAVARSGENPRWLSSKDTFLFPSGAIAFAYGAVQPEKLRGGQHHFAWCDELAKWPGGRGRPRADTAFDNLVLGLRLGEKPRTIVTTTPRPSRLLKRILKLRRTVRTCGRTGDNSHLPADYIEAASEMFGGTRLGRQELEGILFDDLEGALWTRDMIEAARVALPGLPLPRGEGWGERPRPPEYGLTSRTPSPYPPPEGEGLAARSFFKRVVVGVDPPAGADGDACGIVVCAMGADGIAYVLADLSVQGLRPEGWARRVAAAAEAWDAQRVVAEKNQGGDMVESVLRAADSSLPVKLVAATKGKAARAEPIALRFETGKAKLAGSFPELEDELCAITYAGYEGPTNSPDRADAMVWAMTELFKKPAVVPRVRML